MKSWKLVVVAAVVGLFASGAVADDWRLTVHADHPGAKINPHFYGLMTEEINHAYDGGLYAELIQNRSFKDDDANPVHWSIVQGNGNSAAISLDNLDPINSALSISLKLDASSAAAGQRVGVANDGFWGIPANPNTTYHTSFYAKGSEGFTGPLTVDIESADGAMVLGTATIPAITSTWAKYEADIKNGDIQPSTTNRFVISTEKPGTVWFSLVSLFPPTFDNRVNGNRIDLMQLLDDMHPAFLRFPGGNYVDPGHYEWKITVGPVDQRTGHPGAWIYRASDGFGMYEFLKWCEELKMEPLLAVSDGRGWLPADGDVSQLVQDALDEIEYVSGSADSKWGSMRAAAGHPAPFQLHYVEIGNEDFFDRKATYNARFAKFYDAIRARYPQLKLIATSKSMTSRRPDLIDDHLYASPRNMQAAASNYDHTDRNGPKIFVGEWATQDVATPWDKNTYEKTPPTPSMTAALSDAAYLTGLERNADIVEMCCYAPLFVNVNPGGRQWAQNLIGYDAMNSFGSPSYYMQKMFADNRGDVVLPVEISKQASETESIAKGGIGVGTWNTQAEYKDLKVTHGNTILYQSQFDKGSDEWKPVHGDWQTRDGALAETSDDTGCFNLTGDPNWTDYTYTLKARKISGKEGFLILFHAPDSQTCIWWNLGGWGNTRSALQRSVDGDSKELGSSVNLTIETGRWYDIRIEVKGKKIQCYLNDQLVTSTTDTAATSSLPVFTSASQDAATGDIILKVVNVSPTAQTVQINLTGADSIQPNAAGQLLTGQPSDRNSIEEPKKIIPTDLTISDAGTKFSHEFPASSVSVLRLKTR